MAKNIWRKMLALGVLLTLVLGMVSVVKADGEVYIAVEVYTSDGAKVSDAYDGRAATVTVIDQNTGEETPISGTLEDGWVIVAISDDAISPGDRIRIKLDGSAWGDADYYLHALGDQDVIDFVYGGIPGLPIQAQSYEFAPMNLKPIIALVFIILILLFGFLFLASLNRQKVNLIVTKKERVKEQTKQGVVEIWQYTCGYGEPDNLTDLGEFKDIRDFGESSLIKLSVRKIVKMPDGMYGWYNPKAFDMAKLPPEKKPIKVDDEEKIDKKWFQGGAIELKRGQTMKSASRSVTHAKFACCVYPFLILELIFGIGSLFYESLWFPPSIIILIINILILVFAIIFMAASYAKATKEEKPPKPVVPGAQPERLEEWKPIKPEAAKEEPAAPVEAEAPKVAPVAPAAAPAEAPAEEPKAEAAPAAAAPPEAPPEKTICPNCGQEISVDFVICPFCGEALK